MGITLFYISNQINMFVVRLHLMRGFYTDRQISMISLIEPLRHH